MHNKTITLTVIGFFIIGLISIFMRNEPLLVVPTRTIDVYSNVASTKDQAKTVKLLQDAEVVKALESNTTFTVFAPTDEAYAKLPKATLQDLATNKDDQIYTANNHLVLGSFPVSSFNDGMQLTTVNAEIITITKRNGTWYVNDAPIVGAEKVSKNGVIHTINGVLLPKNK